MATTVTFGTVWSGRKPRARPLTLDTKEKITRRLAIMLARDDGRRRRPVSLPGRPAATGTGPVQTLPAVARVQCEPHGHNGRASIRSESEMSDGNGPYTLGQLLEMNARFVARVRAAFDAGTESPEAARRESFTRRRGSSG